MLRINLLERSLYARDCAVLYNNRKRRHGCQLHPGARECLLTDMIHLVSARWVVALQQTRPLVRRALLLHFSLLVFHGHGTVQDVVLDNKDDVEAYADQAETELGEVTNSAGPIAGQRGVEEKLNDREDAARQVEYDVLYRPAKRRLAAEVEQHLRKVLDESDDQLDAREDLNKVDPLQRRPFACPRLVSARDDADETCDEDDQGEDHQKQLNGSRGPLAGCAVVEDGLKEREGGYYEGVNGEGDVVQLHQVVLASMPVAILLSDSGRGEEGEVEDGIAEETECVEHSKVEGEAGD